MQNNKQQKLTVCLQENQYINPSYQLYRGMSGFQDYGIMGIRIKNNLINIWKNLFIYNDNVEEIETPVTMPYHLLKASGHVDKFDDFIVFDEVSKKDIRADHLAKKWFKNNNMIDMVDQVEGFNQETLAENINKYKMLVNNDGSDIKVKRKNLMFSVGDSIVEPDYLRPEIAQAMFVNFKEINRFLQKELPFGIAQIGKSFRREISPESFVRLREFNQAEIEYFFDPSKNIFPKFNKFKNTIIPLLTSDMQLEGKDIMFITAEDAVNNNLIKNPIMAYFLAKIYIFAMKIGLKNDKIRFRQHLPNEMAHYASECFDLECFVNDGWLECVGCANRGSFDLEAHSKGSGQKLTCKKQLDEPIIIEKLKINIKKGAVASKYKGLTSDIVKNIELLTQEQISKIETEFNININDTDYLIETNMFTIQNEKIKIVHEDFYPHVIEPSFGIDRLIYAIFEQNFNIIDKTRIVMSLPSVLAPYDVAVFPLLKRTELVQVAMEINNIFEENGTKYFYDNSSTTIGKKYVRVDEIGIKYAITVDYETLDDKCVTIRERDSQIQERVLISEIVTWLNSKI
jgi:glycyl-tRNA synthetase